MLPDCEQIDTKKKLRDINLNYVSNSNVLCAGGKITAKNGHADIFKNYCWQANSMSVRQMTVV